ncbi:MAG: AAA family ATPase [Lachnospiraceae bacterium]|nr:AAA family ATPase [Lachnospiraceae bacterium]
MNIKRAKEEIKDTIEAYLLKDEEGEYVIPSIRQRPVLLLGAPGIGKTQIMEQIARECGIGLVAYTITHHTRQSAIGLPFISRKDFGGKEYAVTEYTMSEIVASIYEKMEQTGLSEGILFLDEINCVSETLAPAMLQFLQCKTFGNHAIPQGWIIVAAGNPPEYNKSVREFDVVTMDRVKKIEVEPDFAVWKEYARKEHMHPAVVSYLTARNGYFYKMETTVDGRKFATPRGWEDLSRLLEVYEKLGKKVDREVAVQYIQHEKIAKDFANYLELFEKYQMDYQLEAVLAGKIDDMLLKKASHASFDERLSVVSLLMSRCSQAFSEVSCGEKEMELLFEQLKLLKEGMLGIYIQSPQEYAGEIAGAFAQEYERRKKAELLSREEARIYRSVLRKLEEQAFRLQKAGDTDGAAAFEKIRDWFDKEQDLLEERREEAGAMLEHAFDFMEAAFGTGQELVIFITELNADYHSIRFLQEYECERYYRYNKSLLFEENSRAIEARLREL